MRKDVIVGTAGHVDHGKTSLIKALTGTDTDRLKEEKKRGITIELGFTNMPNDQNLDIGIIDVPGHERFIKNMLAGIGGIDIALLVIAADEGIMPQTAEHFEILKMLRIKQGIIALTKVDLVDKDWLEMVKEDIRGFVANTFLEQAPVIEVSAYTGQNITELKKTICEMAEKSEVRRKDPELLRLPIDRVFTIDGFGTVITGTLIEGTISVQDEVEIYPKGRIVKVRNLQVHGNAVEKAYAGQRTAVNLSNIKKEELKRGDVLAMKGSLIPTMMLDVKIDMFKDSPRTLINGSRLHLYHGSAEVLCKVLLLDTEQLESGQSGFAQLRLEEQIVARKDDRFILRFYSPLESIGGGIILNSNPPRRKRFDPDAIELFSVIEQGGREELLELALKEGSKKMITLMEISRQIGLTSEETNQMITPLLQCGKAVRLTEHLIVHRTYIDYVTKKASEILTAFHAENPIRQGMPKEEFRRRLEEKLFIGNTRITDIMIDKMITEQIITDYGNIISLKGFSIMYSPEMKELKNRIENEYKKRCFEAPDTMELIKILNYEKNKLPVLQMLEILQSEGRLKKLTYDCYISADCFDIAVNLLKHYITENGQITLSEYRDLLGTSRKYAIRILEYLDQQKVTKLVGDARVLVV